MNLGSFFYSFLLEQPEQSSFCVHHGLCIPAKNEIAMASGWKAEPGISNFPSLPSKQGLQWEGQSGIRLLPRQQTPVHFPFFPSSDALELGVGCTIKQACIWKQNNFPEQKVLERTHLEWIPCFFPGIRKVCKFWAGAEGLSIALQSNSIGNPTDKWKIHETSFLIHEKSWVEVFLLSSFWLLTM